MQSNIFMESPQFKKFIIAFFVALIVLALIFFYSYITRPYHQSDLIADLEQQGANVTFIGEGASWRIFYLNGTHLNISGQSIQVFDYPEKKQADYFINQIDSGGYNIGKGQVYWKGLPHFFRKNNLLVLYVGNNTETLQVLNSVLGEQFAGK